MRLWRIAGASHPVWSGEGARRMGARWNPSGRPAIYAGTSYAIAALEILVHANAQELPRRLRYVEADLPDDAGIERADVARLVGWDVANVEAPQLFGEAWLRERRSLVLLVPSVVTQGLDWNAVVNPLHRDFARIAVSPEKPAPWDARLNVPT
jgi:RES domain-containing protein